MKGLHRTTHLVTAALAFGAVFSSGLVAQVMTAESEAVAKIEADVRWLADDAREGRGVGTDGLRASAEYIAMRFEDLGLEPGGTDGYFQPFEMGSSPMLASVAGTLVRNVVGILPGRGDLAGQVVVYGAHFDHLGTGTGVYAHAVTDTASANQVHNGADDNASGTAALMYAAELLAAREAPSRRTLVFVAFTAEELGTIGSQYYVDNPALPNDSTVAMVNFDMVGRLKGDSLIIGGTASASELEAAIEVVNADYGFTISKQRTPWGASDHYVFYAEAIPVLHLYTNTHSDYHNPNDDWDKIKSAGIAKITRFAVDLGWSFATEPTQLTYAAVPKPEIRTGQRASLGTIPDFGGGSDGFRLRGVTPASAAEEAGLQGGDVIVQIGDVEVKDIYGLQGALTTYKTGQTVTIVFIRDGERMETEATLK